VLVDVVMSILGLMVVDDAFIDRGSLVSLRCGLRMDRGHPFLPGGFRRLLRGKRVAPQGRTLGLLHGRSLEETSNLITSPTGLRGRWFKHVAEKHGSGDDVLASSVEDRGFARLILDDATIDVASSISSSFAMYACRMLPLEGLLKQAQAFSLLVELGLQFLNLNELRSLVCFERLGSTSCTRVHCVGW
jgi:hypothetical protein